MAQNNETSKAITLCLELNFGLNLYRWKALNKRSMMVTLDKKFEVIKRREILITLSP